MCHDRLAIAAILLRYCATAEGGVSHVFGSAQGKEKGDEWCFLVLARGGMAAHCPLALLVENKVISLTTWSTSVIGMLRQR
jgi:hypothetical protein